MAFLLLVFLKILTAHLSNRNTSFAEFDIAVCTLVDFVVLTKAGYCGPTIVNEARIPREDPQEKLQMPIKEL